MRLGQLVIYLAASVITITLVLYVSLPGSSAERSSDREREIRSQLYFHLPSSLFPPSAIISLTDENSTFFLARPAAYGPLLPHKTLTGQLWIGSGFGEEYIGSGGLAANSEGELGCSDVPGWDDGGREALGRLKDERVGLPISAAGPSSSSNAKAGIDPVDDEDAYSTGESLGGNKGSDEAFRHSVKAKRSRSVKGSAVHDISHPSLHADIQSLQEMAEIQGKIVLLSRGGCGFLDKTKWVQRRGGMALIVGDNVRGGSLVPMYARGDTSNITIPSIFTSHMTAHLLASLVPSANIIKPPSIDGVRRSSTTPDTRLRKREPLNEARRSRRRDRHRSVPSNDRVPAQTGRKSPATFWSHLGFGNLRNQVVNTADDSRRPPTSGHHEWAALGQKRDDHPSEDARRTAKLPLKRGSVVPSSGEYSEHSTTAGSGSVGGDSSNVQGGEIDDETEPRGWLSWLLWSDDKDDSSTESTSIESESSVPKISESTSSNGNDQDYEDMGVEPKDRDGLWVTLSPTTMSSSPFFDTLVVLVISPLVTLSIVYAMLLLRSRIRRRRWRAPKSVVEQLPVRTYQTMSSHTSPFSSPARSPIRASPTTPLLQHDVRSSSAEPRPHSRTTTAIADQHSSSMPEHEKREGGLSQWRRRYGGKQVECVVCLEEYVDGVSRVMSLPCGHEFHADCITPWLTTRRRTCPICKVDVVRSMARASGSNHHQSTVLEGSDDDQQLEVTEYRRNSLTGATSIQRGLNIDADIERGADMPQYAGSSYQSTADSYFVTIQDALGSSSSSGSSNRPAQRLGSADRGR